MAPPSTMTMSLLRRALVGLGRFARLQFRFSLILLGGSWGVVRETFAPSSWRRTTRIEFWQTLRQTTGGGLMSVLVTAALTGFGLVAQAVYWLGFAGMAQMTGSVLSTVLVREIAPVLVGIILLGRSGMLVLTELATLTMGGQMRVLTGMGIDPFLSFVMPRTLAMTISGFTLGIIFSLVALVTGYIVCWVEGAITLSVWGFLDQVTSGMRPIDYFSVPMKFTLSGFMVGLSSCLSGMDTTDEDDLATLLPRGFARGILSVMIINVVFTVGFE